jgi:hypothetical protein
MPGRVHQDIDVAGGWWFISRVSKRVTHSFMQCCGNRQGIGPLVDDQIVGPGDANPCQSVCSVSKVTSGTGRAGSFSLASNCLAWTCPIRTTCSPNSDEPPIWSAW